MTLIIGSVIVTVSVISGFLLAGGNLMILLQWAEFIIIVGAAIGGLIISAPMPVLKKVIASISQLVKSESYTKQDYLELLKSFNDLFLVAQRDGLLAIERHVEKPEESEILSVSKKFIGNPLYRDFFCDTLKVMLSGGIPPHELEELIDSEIETFEMESKPVVGIIQKTGDALPGLGIVAAVLGIIVTMASIDKGPAYVGMHVAAALVGTFLGVLLAYGYVNPMATNLELSTEATAGYLRTIKACIVAYSRGNPPIIAVEFARRTIPSDTRPTFSELENYVRRKSE